MEIYFSHFSRLKANQHRPTGTVHSTVLIQRITNSSCFLFWKKNILFMVNIACMIWECVYEFLFQPHNSHMPKIFLTGPQFIFCVLFSFWVFPSYIHRQHRLITTIAYAYECERVSVCVIFQKKWKITQIEFACFWYSRGVSLAFARLNESSFGLMGLAKLLIL